MSTVMYTQIGSYIVVRWLTLFEVVDNRANAALFASPLPVGMLIPPTYSDDNVPACGPTIRHFWVRVFDSQLKGSGFDPKCPETICKSLRANTYPHAPELIGFGLRRHFNRDLIYFEAFPNIITYQTDRQ